MAEAKKKVCIVGTASSKIYTPFEDTSYEFWGVNNLFIVKLPHMHYDRWFDVHPIEFDANKQTWLRRGESDFRGQNVSEYLKDLAKLDIPVYTRKIVEAVPKSLEYPIDDVVKWFGGLNYLTNTIALEVALAIMEGFEEIAIYGVDMGIGTEYGSQRPSVELYIGMALAKGIKMRIPDECDLLKSKFIYGIEEPQQTAFNVRLSAIKKDADKRIKESELLAKKHREESLYHKGAMSMLDTITKLWANNNDKF